MIRSLAFVCLLALIATTLRAHDPGVSASCVTLHPDHFAVHVSFNGGDVARLAGIDYDADGKLSPSEFARGRSHVLTTLGADVALRLAGYALPAQSIDVELDQEGGVELHLRFAREGHGDLLLEVATIERMPRGHRQYATAVSADGALLADALLHRGHTQLSAAVGKAPSTSNRAVQFFVLGVEHILIGYDHILFLLALLLAGGTLRAAAAVITSFTVSHSVTLGLATLGIVNLPALFVEATIAASIVWVAVENIIRREPKHRWRTTFLFGLVHGFGFASVLGELGVSQHAGTALPLFSFNLGVEIGQLVIACVALPPLRWILRSRWQRPIVIGLSLATALMGLAWLAERTVLA